MAASAQVAFNSDSCIKVQVLGSTAVLCATYMCLTDSARDKDEVTKDKKMNICLKL